MPLTTSPLALQEETKKRRAQEQRAAGAQTAQALTRAAVELNQLPIRTFQALPGREVSKNIVESTGNFVDGFIGRQPTIAKPVPRTDFAPSNLSLAPGRPYVAPVAAKPDKPAATPTIEQPAMQAAAAKAGGDEVIGTVNGRNITRAESERLAGSLPTASGPVVMGPNGSYAAARGSTPAASNVPAIAMPTYSSQGQGAVIGNPGTGLEAERQKLMSNLTSQISQLSLNPNSRGKRDLLASLLQMQARMNESASGNEVALSGQQNQADIAAMNEAGQNRRFDVQDASDNRQFDAQDATTRELGATREMGDTYRALLNLQPRAELMTDASGNVVRVDGTRADAVTGADGSPLRTANRDGLTQKDVLASLDAQEKALVDAMALGGTPETQAQLQRVRTQRDAILNPAPAGPKAGEVKSGYRFKGGDPANQANWEKVS